jgi:hypothetical protein
MNDRKPAERPPLSNPTLYHAALTDDERSPAFKWHAHSDSPRSSQAFCVSAFGSLRSVSAKDNILNALFARHIPDLPRCEGRRWTIRLEAEDPDLLSERGSNQPTSIDALCSTDNAVVCIESKFVTDAAAGFGSCGQHPRTCHGFHGPGSDKAKGTQAWCRLENWEGKRSPRNYWSFGRRWFRPEVFRVQSAGEVCPLRGANYQLMRNFLFAAALAERDRRSSFGVLAIAPRRFAPLLEAQVAAFRTDVLRTEFHGCISFATYESYIELLENCTEPKVADLAGFLAQRIRVVVDQKH